MRRASKTLIAALAVLLLAIGLAACGSSSGSSSTTEAEGQAQAEGKPSGSPKQGEAKGSGEEKGGSGSQEGQSKRASEFVPEHHHDSGGGSAQFRVKGGDNSVQEFGGEADTSERDAAAVAFHNFLDARAEGNWAAVCNYMSKSTIESFEKLAEQLKSKEALSCGEILEQLTNPAAKQSMRAEATKADVGSLRVEGEQSFLIYTVDGTVLAMPMANEEGTWKVAGLSGTPLS